MVVPAAPIIPSDDDRCIGPVRAVANRVHDRSNPRRSAGACGDACMVRILPGGDNPAHRGEGTVGDVVEYRRWLIFCVQHDVMDPICTRAGGRAWRGSVRAADVLNGIRSRPDGTCARGVIAPGHSVGIQFVGERRMLEAGVYLLRFLARGIDQLDCCAGRSRATGVVKGRSS